MAKLQRVEVRWLDAVLRVGTRTIGEAAALTPLVRRSAGYLVVKTADHITLAMTDDLDGEVDDVLVLPLEWVTEICYLITGGTDADIP